MAYVIDFVTQNPILSDKLLLDKNEKLDSLRRERSKKHITFKGGGGVQTLTLDARNSRASMEAAMGFGAKNIIADEAGLIDDPIWSTVMRMLGGAGKYKDTFLLKIGNPFYRNHFHKSSISNRYHQIRHTYLDSLQDSQDGYHGFDETFMEEMKGEANWEVYYECKFPNEDEIDARGYRTLIPMDLLIDRYVDKKTDGDNLRLGVDVGGGGDKNVYVLRNGKCAWIESSNKSNDTMTNVTEIVRLIKEYNITPQDVFIDDIGIGRGVTDRLIEMGHPVSGVSVGGSATENDKYSNIKAEVSWKARTWLKEGGKIVRDDGFNQLNWIKYKVNTEKLMKIEPKADLKKRTGKSPDYADAFFLTFGESNLPFVY